MSPFPFFWRKSQNTDQSEFPDLPAVVEIEALLLGNVVGTITRQVELVGQVITEIWEERADPISPEELWIVDVEVFGFLFHTARSIAFDAGGIVARRGLERQLDTLVLTSLTMSHAAFAGGDAGLTAFRTATRDPINDAVDSYVTLMDSMSNGADDPDYQPSKGELLILAAAGLGNRVADLVDRDDVSELVTSSTLAVINSDEEDANLATLSTNVQLWAVTQE